MSMLDTSQLAQFTGTQGYYRIGRRHLLTDGSKYLADHAQCVSVQQSHLEIGSEVLQDCVHKFDCGHNAQYLRQAKILDPANPSQIFA